MTEEHRQKIIKANTGRVHRTGIKWKHSKEAIEKIRLSKLGKKFSIEHMLSLKNNHKGFLGLKHSIKTRKILSKQRKAGNGSNWKGGITSENKVIRKSLEYKLWRTAVFERDNYACLWCGKRSGNGSTVILNADHIKPFALFPELRFAIDNGRTLCVECHKTTETYGGKSARL